MAVAAHPAALVYPDKLFPASAYWFASVPVFFILFSVFFKFSFSVKKWRLPERERLHLAQFSAELIY